MSSQFQPLEIPPGVVSTPTKKTRSSNWSEVNMLRWRENQLTPFGGQVQFSNVVGGVDQYVFASKCKRIHGWRDINDVYHIAYLCEQNLYVDTGGVLQDISPVPPIVPPSGVGGGYGDGLYSPPPPATSIYGRAPDVPASVSITKTPDAYSLDNFGGILYAMTSADGRLLKWDPLAGSGSVTGVTTTAAYTTASPDIYTTGIPGTVSSGFVVRDITTNHNIGTVSSITPVTGTSTAQWTFAADQPSFVSTPLPANIGAGATVFDVTTGNALGIVATHAVRTVTALATAAYTASYKSVFMANNPGVVPGMTMKDLTSGNTLGTVSFYGPFGRGGQCSVPMSSGQTAITMDSPGNSGQTIVPGMTVTSVDFPGWTSTVVSYINRALVLSVGLPNSKSNAFFFFDSGTQHVASWVGSFFASTGAADNIQFTTGTNEVVTLASNIPSGSSTANDSMSYGGISKLTLAAPAAFAGAAGNSLQFGGNPASVQTADVGPPTRGPVPNGRCFVVTQERFIMIFGSYNDGTAGGSAGGSRRRFAWCDQENPGAWDYSNVVSMAGFLDIEPASPIICADASRTGVIFWTATKAYASRFLGLPYIYNYLELCDGTTPWSPQSVTTTSSLTLWMSEQGPMSYDGTSVLPVKCPIRPWIDDDIDPVAVRELSFACHLAEFNEWWWFYPTLNSPFNNRVAIFCYKEGWWSQARMSRSAGMSSSYTAHPIFADDYVAFQHEVFLAASYANASMPVELPFAETFDINLGSGVRLTTIKQIIPDVEPVDSDVLANLTYSVFYRNSRSTGAPERQSFGKPRVNGLEGYIDFRVTGRDLRLRIDVGTPIQPFTLGQHLIDSVQRGDR